MFTWYQYTFILCVIELIKREITMTQNKVYSVFLYTLGYYLQDEFSTREAAQAAGEKCGFSFIIEEEA